MKRILTLVSLVLAIALIAIACGPPPSQPGGEAEPAAGTEADATPEPDAEAAEAAPEPTATTIVAETGSGDLQLVYWNGLTGSDGSTMVEMVEAYARENEEVSVRVEMMQWETYFDKLITSLVSGSPPDLFLLHEFEIPQFASQGVLQDTSSYFNSDGGPIPEEDIAPFALEALNYEGGQFGVPIDIHGWGLWYNQDVFDEAGLEGCPATGDEFVEYARAITTDANGNHPGDAGFDAENVAVYGTTVGWMKPSFLTLLWQNGGNWTDGEGNATINSEAGIDAAAFWVDLIEQGMAPEPAGFDNRQSFAASQIGMMPDGSWTLNFVENNEMNWGVCPFPQVGETPAVWISSHTVYTPQGLDGEKLEAAQGLINYLSDQGLLWATSGQPPARKSQLAEMTVEEFPSAKVLGDSFLERGQYDYAHECMQEVIDTGYMPELDSIFNLDKTVEEGLNDANERIQGILDRC